jgi:hypothetical protein
VINYLSKAAWSALNELNVTDTFYTMFHVMFGGKNTGILETKIIRHNKCDQDFDDRGEYLKDVRQFKLDVISSFNSNVKAFVFVEKAHITKYDLSCFDAIISQAYINNGNKLVGILPIKNNKVIDDLYVIHLHDAILDFGFGESLEV